MHHGTIGARLGPDQGEIALSLVALLYKAASSATPAVRMVRGVPRGFWEGVVLLGISPELIFDPVNPPATVGILLLTIC